MPASEEVYAEFLAIQDEELTDHRPLDTEEILSSVMDLYNTLLLIDGLIDTPIRENVADAIKRFNAPGLRPELARRVKECPPSQGA